jgi:hypothetical protein
VTVDLPADQRLLLDDLQSRLDTIAEPEQLVRVMGEVLRSLLRRKGDAEFLMAVQDAFTNGLTDRSFEEQRLLAREVVRVVIEKRPEIARAWQALNAPAQETAPARRQADAEPLPPPEPQPLAPPPADFYHFSQAEELVGDYVAGVLDRRLSIFQVPPPRIPSMTYCHERPFFLFTADFRMVAHAFVCGPLMRQCRDALEVRIYQDLDAATLADRDKVNALLTERKPDIWKVFIERLSRLAANQRSAEDKMAAAAAMDPNEPEFKLVDTPYVRPRRYRILGVEFALGSETATRKVKVRNRPSTELESAEREAMGAIGTFRDMAAKAGLDLPSACDFQLLRTLFEFDAKRLGQTLKELSLLAEHQETNRAYLFERLKGVDEQFTSHVSDIMTLMLFYQLGDERFGLKEVHELAVGSGRDKTASASRRPFLLSEVGRRPRELAFQVRETIRRRSETRFFLTAVKMLAACYQVMSRARFEHELEAGLTVLGAFPLAFTGDPAEDAIAKLGYLLQDALGADKPDLAAIVTQATAAYEALPR